MKVKCKVLHTISKSITVGKIYESDYIDPDGIAMIEDDDGDHSVLWNHEYEIVE